MSPKVQQAILDSVFKFANRKKIAIHGRDKTSTSHWLVGWEGGWQRELWDGKGDGVEKKVIICCNRITFNIVFFLNVSTKFTGQNEKLINCYFSITKLLQEMNGNEWRKKLSCEVKNTHQNCSLHLCNLPRSYRYSAPPGSNIQLRSGRDLGNTHQYLKK